MKTIIHICLTSPLRDGMGYDENILPLYHKNLGLTVYIITKKDEEKCELESVYKGIKVFRLDSGNRFGRLSHWGDYPALYQTLEQLAPDIIYIHNPQFVGFLDIIKYKKHHRSLTIYADSHEDYYNSPIKTFKCFVVRCILFRLMFLAYQRYVKIFWGVTPWRCDYLREVYGISKRKIRLLVMGGDDQNIDFQSQKIVRKEIRRKYNIPDEAILIISGGKINREKNIHYLIQAVSEVEIKNVYLLIFGKVEDGFQSDFQLYLHNERVVFAGWIEPEKIYDYFLASDLAFFPGTHSILWEQACSCGLPIAVKFWERMTHLDLGGNAFFIRDINIENLRRSISDICGNNEKLSQAKEIAQNKGTKYFAYSRIAKEAIEFDT